MSVNKAQVVARVISLDPHPRLVDNLLKHGFDSAVLLPAVVGRDVDLSSVPLSDHTRMLIANPGLRTTHEELANRAMMGCFLSHIKALRLQVRNKESLAFVFEDDAKPDWKKLDTVLHDLPSHFDVFLLGYDRRLTNSKRWFGCHALLWSLQGATKFLKMYKEHGITHQIDGFMSIQNDEGRLDVQFAPEPVVFQHAHISSLQTQFCWKCPLLATEGQAFWRRREIINLAGFTLASALALLITPLV